MNRSKLKIHVHVTQSKLFPGSFTPAVFLIGTGFVTCEQRYLAVALLTLAVGCSGAIYSGFVVNMVDIVPPFAGILFGISNTVATIPGILAPYAIGVITSDVSVGKEVGERAGSG